MDFMKFLVTTIQGMLMGVGEIVPVAGASTMALIMGIYDDFVNFLYSISTFVKTLLKFCVTRATFTEVKQSFKEIEFSFGVPLTLGALLAIILFTRAMNTLLENNSTEVYAVVFGLVLSSTWIPFREITRIGMREVLAFAITAISLFVFFGLNSFSTVDNASPIFFLFAGLLSISAIVLPGISVSFILILLGVYETLLGLVSKLLNFQINSAEILSLGMFIVGAVIGFVAFVRFLKYSLTHFTNIVFAILVGAMVASLRVLWPFGESNVPLPALALLVLIGICIPWVVKWISNKTNKDKLKIKPEPV